MSLWWTLLLSGPSVALAASAGAVLEPDPITPGQTTQATQAATPGQATQARPLARPLAVMDGDAPTVPETDFSNEISEFVHLCIDKVRRCSDVKPPLI